MFFFSIRIFFHIPWRFTGQQGKGGDHFLFHSTTYTRSRTFRHLFTTLHVRWLSRIFNRTAWIYQTATTLLNYRLIYWWCNVNFFVCLLDDLILGFCYSNLTREAGGFELASAIILVLQANQRTKWASVKIRRSILFGNQKSC